VHEQLDRSSHDRGVIRRPRRSRIVGLFGLTLLIGALVAPATTSAATTAEAGCAGHWPAAVQGKPTLLVAGARAGDYIWHDAYGWHLRVTHATSSRLVFSGRITASAPMRVTPFRLESGDWVALSADRLTITYRFVNYGHLDGLDFTTACARRVTFGGAMAGTKLPITRIWIGRHNRHPLQNPFSVFRVL